MSENYLGIITENYEWELSSENYDLVEIYRDTGVSKKSCTVIWVIYYNKYLQYCRRQFKFVNSIGAKRNGLVDFYQTSYCFKVNNTELYASLTFSIYFK